MHLEISVSTVLQNCQNLIEMTSNMIFALGVGLKCPPKVHLNTQWLERTKIWQSSSMDSSKKLNVM